MRDLLCQFLLELDLGEVLPQQASLPKTYVAMAAKHPKADRHQTSMLTLNTFPIINLRSLTDLSELNTEACSYQTQIQGLPIIIRTTFQEAG